MGIEDILREGLSRYDAAIAGNKKISDILQRIGTKSLTYPDALSFSSMTGLEMGDIITGLLVREDSPLSEEDMTRLLDGLLKSNYGQVAEVIRDVQEIVNEDAEIGLKPLVPDYNLDRAQGIGKHISSIDDIASHVDKIQQLIENNSMSIVDEAIRLNAEAHTKAGLQATVIRKYDGVGLHDRKESCKFCLSRAGTFSYQEAVSKDVFRRHPGCGCEITYITGKRVQRQTKWESNTWTDVQDDAILEKRKTYGLAPGTFYKTPAFNSKADPMADVLGRGVDSHPNEVKVFREECRQAGVEIIERENESLSYQPSPVLGKPGQLTVSKDASYSAWCHEMQHMYDDMESGWDGALKVWDRDEHVKREEKAYNIEIQMALDLGRPDIADILKKNMEAERRRIYGTP